MILAYGGISKETHCEYSPGSIRSLCALNRRRTPYSFKCLFPVSREETVEMASLRDVYDGGLEYTRGPKTREEEIKALFTLHLDSIQPATPLKSDYLDVSSYFVQTSTGKVFGISYADGDFTPVTEEMANHLRQLNMKF